MSCGRRTRSCGRPRRISRRRSSTAPVQEVIVAFMEYPWATTSGSSRCAECCRSPRFPPGTEARPSGRSIPIGCRSGRSRDATVVVLYPAGFRGELRRLRRSEDPRRQLAREGIGVARCTVPPGSMKAHGPARGCSRQAGRRRRSATQRCLPAGQGEPADQPRRPAQSGFWCPTSPTSPPGAASSTSRS